MASWTSSDILFYKLFKIISTGAGASASIQRISRFNPKNFRLSFPLVPRFYLIKVKETNDKRKAKHFLLRESNKNLISDILSSIFWLWHWLWLFSWCRWRDLYDCLDVCKNLANTKKIFYNQINTKQSLFCRHSIFSASLHWTWQYFFWRPRFFWFQWYSFFFFRCLPFITFHCATKQKQSFKIEKSFKLLLRNCAIKNDRLLFFLLWLESHFNSQSYYIQLLRIQIFMEISQFEKKINRFLFFRCCLGFVEGNINKTEKSRFVCTGGQRGGTKRYREKISSLPINFHWKKRENVAEASWWRSLWG